MANFIRIVFLVTSWFTVALLPKDVFKKFAPVANLAISFVLIQSLCYRVK